MNNTNKKQEYKAPTIQELIINSDDIVTTSPFDPTMDKDNPIEEKETDLPLSSSNRDF